MIEDKPSPEDENEIKNKTVDNSKLANVISVSNESNAIYNGGSINYTVRHIQRSIGTLRQAGLLEDERMYAYKPALLWEVSGTENTKSIKTKLVHSPHTFLLPSL